MKLLSDIDHVNSRSCDFLQESAKSDCIIMKVLAGQAVCPGIEFTLCVV